MSQSTYNSTKKSYTAIEIQVWLSTQISEMLGITLNEIDVTAPLDSYGLDSAQGMLLASKASKLLGFQLSPLLLWHYPTIELLSQRLAEEFQNSELEIFEI
jgi:acyl carrier protein